MQEPRQRSKLNCVPDLLHYVNSGLLQLLDQAEELFIDQLLLRWFVVVLRLVVLVVPSVPVASSVLLVPLTSVLAVVILTFLP